MHAQPVDRQAQRRIPRPTGAQRAQEGIFDAHHRHATPRRHSLTPPGAGAAAPDHHPVARPGKTQPQVMPGKGQDAAQARLAQKATVVKEQPPGKTPGGCVMSVCGHRGQPPLAVALRLEAVEAVPVITDSDFCH